MANSSNIIGLRIGQSYSSIAIINKDGRADCIANEDGERQIPTMVAFSGEEEFTGTQSKVQLLNNSKNTITQFRNFIGRSYTECKLMTSNSTPTTITATPLINKDDKPAYSVEFKDQETIFTVEDIFIKYIKSLKESAENFLGFPVEGSVLAVPTYFTEKQREALKTVTENAGLQVLQIINEPTAAVLAYHQHQQNLFANSSSTALLNNNNNATSTTTSTTTSCSLSPLNINYSNILVVDLGSDSLDVTILLVRSGIYTILATIHDPNLGGSAFDDLLINHFKNEFKRKTKIDITNNKRALMKLKNSVEFTKKTLSSSTVAPCSVESLAEGMDFHGNINRTRFEIMANKIFNKIFEIVVNILENNQLKPQYVDEVILVGGASRIPKIQIKLQEVFQNSNKTIIRQDLEPDEIVAYGCVYQALFIANLNNIQTIKGFLESTTSTTLLSTPHLSKTIGTVIAATNDNNDGFVTLIPDNAPLPIRRIFQFTNSKENQKAVYVPIWEGAYKLISDTNPIKNTLLCQKHY
ncbi:5049_t:CDS:2 [Entrophospora sp. SA101]|nr:5049_t:CDS:2 [Entrophospora sp. SA101]CAJ0873600.1 6449_t:CDS:2 [Entrophospora sp. SA101]